MIRPGINHSYSTRSSLADQSFLPPSPSPSPSPSQSQSRSLYAPHPVVSVLLTIHLSAAQTRDNLRRRCRQQPSTWSRQRYVTQATRGLPFHHVVASFIRSRHPPAHRSETCLFLKAPVVKTFVPLFWAFQPEPALHCISFQSCRASLFGSKSSRIRKAQGVSNVPYAGSPPA